MVKKFAFFLFLPFWIVVDKFWPKENNLWAFSTHHLHSGRFIENQRAIFEYIKSNPNIRKIIFYRNFLEDGFSIENACNYEVVKHGSLKGIFLLMRCKVLFLTHSISMDYSIRWWGNEFSILPLDMKNRVVINLWHAISLKKLYYTANKDTRLHTDRVSYRVKERRGYKGLIASSDVDSYAMASMFYPLNYLNVWITGLPRNDFLTMDEKFLPDYIIKSLDNIRKMTKGRKLIVYAPTYRQTSACADAYYYQFSQEEIDLLKSILIENNAVLGYRPHYFENSNKYFNLIEYVDNDLILDISTSKVNEYSAVARQCDLLITDYSSVYIEALYLKKPSICFAYDWDSYKNTQDGLLYDLELIFPKKVCREFDELLLEITNFFKNKNSDEYINEYAKKMFFKYSDGKNSERVCEKILEILKDSSLTIGKGDYLIK